VTKRYDEPIDVIADPVDEGAPVAFSWRGRRYEVDERLTSWLEAATWKVRSQGTLEYHRVLARPHGALATGDLDPDGFLLGAPGVVFDVYRCRAGWRLARIWD
jgi:hypothetical protein